MSKDHLFTSQTAPRAGRPKGAKNKLSAQSMKVIDALMKDFAKHGAAAITTMRVEKPNEYVRLCADISSRWMIATATGRMIEAPPPVIRVTWLSQPPPVQVSDSNVPLLELQADTGESDDVLN